MDNRNKDALPKDSIENAGFTTRTRTCLYRGGIKTMRELAERSEDELMGIRNLGMHSLKEIKDKLEEWKVVIAEMNVETGMEKVGETLEWLIDAPDYFDNRAKNAITLFRLFQATSGANTTDSEKLQYASRMVYAYLMGGDNAIQPHSGARQPSEIAAEYANVKPI